MSFALSWVEFNGHNIADMKMQNLLLTCSHTVLSNGKAVPFGIPCNDGTKSLGVMQSQVITN